MHRIIFLFSFYFFCSHLSAQSKRDHVWLFGYDSGGHLENPIFGGSRMDFGSTPPLMTLDLRDMNFHKTVASICDENGHLLLYTNGNYIANAQGDTVANSTGLLTLQEAQGFVIGAMPLSQGALLLPLPGSEHEFVLIHEALKVLPANPPITNSIQISCGPVYETWIDLSLNDNAGAVTLKRGVLLNDTLDFGKLTAVRHANGRDWWVVIPKFASTLIFRFLLDPQGLHALPPQDVGITLWNGLGQAVFSPDGSKYAHMSLHGQIENYLNILDFDRCTGTFSNPVQIPYNDNDHAGGVAISPNSRYLYLCSVLEIYQYDLHAENIGESRDIVAIYDGYTEVITGTGFEFPTYFFLPQLAPDGKIYVSTTSTVKALHVINYPDLPGEACEVAQHGITLPTLNAFGLPNYPYFRLGTWVGSACDTLGPVAAFVHTEAGLLFDFQDESLKNPTDWHWDFGDGNSSVEQNPQHVYALEGTYPVCLNVSNAYGSSTVCQDIVVMSTGTIEAIGESGVRVYPNPSKGRVTLELRMAVSEFALYDALGRLVWHRQDLAAGWHVFELDDLAPGTYHYKIQDVKARQEAGKLIILF